MIQNIKPCIIRHKSIRSTFISLSHIRMFPKIIVCLIPLYNLIIRAVFSPCVHTPLQIIWKKNGDRKSRGAALRSASDQRDSICPFHQGNDVRTLRKAGEGRSGGTPGGTERTGQPRKKERRCHAFRHAGEFRPGADRAFFHCRTGGGLSTQIRSENR